MDAPEVSVVIPTHRRTGVLADMLAALLEQSYPLDRVEILVVIDGADPAMVELVERSAAAAACPLRTLPQPRSGAGVARNHGAARASGRILLLLDDDIIADRDLIAEHLRHHAGRDDTAVIGAVPVEAFVGEAAHQRDLRRWWDEELARMAAAAFDPTFRDLITGNVSLPRARFLEVGGFDPAFAGYGREDYELGYRLLMSGVRLVHEPRAVGVHRYRKAAGEWLRQWESMGRADVIFARKHPEIAAEVMALSPFPWLPWKPSGTGLGERLTLSLNRRGGAVWKRIAALTMTTHYWAGVRSEVQSDGELHHLVELRRQARAHLGKGGRIRRLLRILFGGSEPTSAVRAAQ